MKKPLYILLLLCLCANARAQETGNNIAAGPVVTEIKGENLDIRFVITASGIEIDCDGQHILEFAVESAERRLVLPVVVYSGAQRPLRAPSRTALGGLSRRALPHI